MRRLGGKEGKEGRMKGRRRKNRERRKGGNKGNHVGENWERANTGRKERLIKI